MSRALPYIVFAFFVVSFALHPYSPFATHDLADPDDYMRLDQTIAWLNGHSWFDLSVPRLSPGAGTTVHWSRLIDLPIAGVALPFIPGFGSAGAALLASFIVPFLYFALLLMLLTAWEHLVTEKTGNLSCVFALFAPLLLFNYTPGRVDHHGAQVLLAAFGLYSLDRILLDDKGAPFAMLAGLAFACGFWIGAEALPWALLFIACSAVAAAWRGGAVARNAALFGLCLTVFTALLIPAALPAADYSSRALSWFSPAYALFSALAGAVLAGGYAIGQHTDKKSLRLAFYSAAGIDAALAFICLVPSVLNGIFTDYDAFDSTVALDSIAEAAPLAAALHVNPFMPASFIHAFIAGSRLLVLPVIAWIACLWAARQSQGSPRLVWLAHGVFLGAALLLTLFWQNRVGIFMEIFMLVPLAWLLGRVWEALRGRLGDRRLFWAEIAAFLGLGFIPVIVMPALFLKTPLYPDIILFPAARAAMPCAFDANLLATLNDPKALGAHPRTIMNVGDSGPELLFATGHNAVAGNFDVAGNADAYEFFHTSDDAVARRAARKWHADLVLLCRDAPLLYLGKDYYALSHSRLQTGADGRLHLVNTEPDQPLIERLIRGQPPEWLKPVEIPGGSDYLLFDIKNLGIK